MELVSQLNEYRSTPTSLKMMASRIDGAQAGFEMEMYVVGVDEDDSNFEPNLDEDELIYDIDGAESFFYDGDFNGRYDCQRLASSMRSDYQDWLLDKAREEWDSEIDSEDVVRKYILDNHYSVDDLREEWAEANDKDIDNPDHQEEIDAGAKELLDAIVEDAMDIDSDGYQDAAYDEWRDEWLEDASDGYETDWLRSLGIRMYSDVPNEYDIQWPYHSPRGGGAAHFDAVAEEVARVTGRKAISAPHGSYDIKPNTYVVTEDASLTSPPDNDMAGVEIVSPPLPIIEALDDFKKIVEWAHNNGAQTDKTTGLHINVSVPGVNRDNLDYLKLALLIGDQYILEQFRRLGNRMTRSAIAVINSRIVNQPADVEAVLLRMKSGFDQLATKVIHSGNTDKFTSINTKQGYVEFRAPGGDWLETEVDIETLLYRYIVALDAAMDPTKFRKEYLTKLYKLFRKSHDTNDPLNLFVQYVSGQITSVDLKQIVRARREELLKKQNEVTDGKKILWKDTMLNPNLAGLEPATGDPNWRNTLAQHLRNVRGNVGGAQDA